MGNFTDAEIVAFLDEALEPGRSAQFESAIRDDEKLRQRLITIRGRESAGLHTLGAIWRRRRLSCPSRTELGGFILGTLPDEQADYIRFHLQDVGCRYCDANLSDLQSATDQSQQSVKRRRKYFQTSAGYLKR